VLLAIDIGNSNVVAGVFDGDQLRAELRLHTDDQQTGDELGLLLSQLLQRRGFETGAITAVAVSNVVPALAGAVEQLSREFFKAEPLVIGPGIRTGIKIRYDDPRQVGADRIANALAVKHLYGSPAIMVDFGTATTIDAVDEEGAYLGGAIAPGLEVSADALVSRAAKLSRVELAAPDSVIGRTTTASMQSGLVFGYVGLVEGLVNRMKVEVGGSPHHGVDAVWLGFWLCRSGGRLGQSDESGGGRLAQSHRHRWLGGVDERFDLDHRPRRPDADLGWT
jgi:type III pantothenate kinase